MCPVVPPSCLPVRSPNRAVEAEVVIRATAIEGGGLWFVVERAVLAQARESSGRQSPSWDELVSLLSPAFGWFNEFEKHRQIRKPFPVCSYPQRKMFAVCRRRVSGEGVLLMANVTGPVSKACRASTKNEIRSPFGVDDQRKQFRCMLCASQLEPNDCRRV